MGVVSMVSAAVVSLLLWFAGVAADASDHRYKINDPVPLYANKVGPFHNPRLGFCSSCSLVSDLSLCFQDLFDLCVFYLLLIRWKWKKRWMSCWGFLARVAGMGGLFYFLGF